MRRDYIFALKERPNTGWHRLNGGGEALCLFLRTRQRNVG
jgi:hypothetical protein